MRKRVPKGTGFWLTLLLNLLFRWEWLLLAVIMLVLHHLLALPLYLVWICLGIWVLWSLVITLFLGWVSKGGKSTPQPAGQRTSERLQKQQAAKCSETNIEIQELED